MTMPVITYHGITHTCTDEDCHLVNFLATLLEPQDPACTDQNASN